MRLIKGDTTKRAMLKNIKITEVSSVGRGANQGALVTMFKTADDEDLLLKQSFNEVMQEIGMSQHLRELLDDMFRMNMALRQSLRSILEDPSVTEKKAAVRESLQQFMSAMEGMLSDDNIVKEIQKAMKTEGGTQFSAGDYAYVPDPESPSTWKLRLTETPGGDPSARIVGMAVAALGPGGFRGNSVQIPQADRAKVVAKVRSAWLKANKGKGEKDLPNVLKSVNEEDLEMSKELQDLQKKFDDQAKDLAKATFLASLSDVEKAHYAKLDETEKEAFQKMDAAGRQIAITKAAEGEETMEIEGAIIKKSEVGPGVFAFMKAQQTKTAAAIAKADKLEADAIQKGLENEAETLWPNTPGTPVEKAQMLKSIRSLPKEQQEGQMKMMKAADTALSGTFNETGVGGGSDPNGPDEKLNKMAQAKAEKDNITIEKAYSEVLKTKEGAALYEQSLKK